MKTKADKSPNPIKLGRSPDTQIEVTEEVIAVAIPRDSGHCMIADAIRANCPNAKYIAVDLQTIRFSDPIKGERYTYLTPRPAQIALVKFDQGEKPVPFTFRLRRGQVTSYGLSLKRRLYQRERNARYDYKQKELERKAFLRKAKGGNSKGGELGSVIPEKVGGRTPPKGALATPAVSPGLRRAFGIRALGTWKG